MKIYMCTKYLIAALVLFILTPTISKTFPDYNTQSEFVCPEGTQCSCSFVMSDYELQCPAYDPNITVRIQPMKYVQMECNTANSDDYATLPSINIGENMMVQIRRCPLPSGKPIQTILDRLGIKQVRSLLFQSYRADLGNTLSRNHLKGLNDLERLVLIGNGLSNLPVDLFMDVKNLTWLDLKRNKVHLPRDIFLSLDKLDYLELGYNSLQNLPPGIFRNQKRLKHLNLWGNSLHNLTMETFDGVSAIEELDLSSNGIETLHKDVFYLLKNLTNLNLSANKFISLPKDLFVENKKLTHIRLLNNRVQLKSLPDGLLSNLTELEDVRIKCELQILPENLFSNSSNLRNLTLEGNVIERIPSGIFKDQIYLLDLDLSKNRIVSLDDETFANTRSLIVLKLSNNELVNISRGIFSKLHSLKELYLDNNNLYRIHPNAFVGTRYLETIKLQNNHLTFKDEESGLYVDHTFDIGSPFQSLTELRSLILRNNSIRSIYRDWIFNNIKLNNLDLSYNNISILSYSDMQFSSRDILVNLTHNSIDEIEFGNIQFVNFEQDVKNIVILLENNPIKCDCILLRFVQFLRGEISVHVKKILNLVPGNLKCSSPSNLIGKLVTEVEPKELLCPLDSIMSSIKKCPYKCYCWVRPIDRGLIINCSNSELNYVPNLPSAKELLLNFIELHIENNNIIRLPKINEIGYSEVKAIYAKNNNISKLNIDNIPKDLTLLDISNNNLQWINSTVFNKLNKTINLQQISLANNPWICDCNTLDLALFVHTNFKRIKDLNMIKCNNGIKLSVFKLNDLCPENESVVIALSILIALFGLLVGILAALYYKYQQEIKVWLFAHNMCLWFVTEDELDRDKKYDAFISYSHKDEDFITEHLLPNLENGPNPFKLCLHIRDWIVGEFIPNQITKSVDDSRRTIVVLSPNFLESIWGRMEFRAAHSAALSEGRARVIVIIYGDIGNIDNLDPELKAYLKMNTYVKWGDPWFWNKLRYAMPHPLHTIKTKGLVKTSIKSSTDDKLELIKPISLTPPLTTPPAEQASKNPLIVKLNGDIKKNNEIIKNCVNGHINGAFIINTNAKQSDV